MEFYACDMEEELVFIADERSKPNGECAVIAWSSHFVMTLACGEDIYNGWMKE